MLNPVSRTGQASFIILSLNRGIPKQVWDDEIVRLD